MLLVYKVLAENFKLGVSDRIERAQAQGTSEINVSRSLEGDWDEWDEEEITPSENLDKLIQEYRAGTNELKILLESLLINWKQVSEGFYSE